MWPFGRRLTPVAPVMYDGPLPPEWIETVWLDLDTYLRDPRPSTCFRLGATLAVVARESDHTPEQLMRYVARDLANTLSLDKATRLHELVSGL